MENAFETTLAQIEKHDDFLSVFDRMTADLENSIAVFSDGQKDSIAEFNKSELARRKKMDLSSRIKNVSEFYDISVKRLKDDMKACVSGEGGSGFATCSPRSLAGRLSQHLSLWNGISTSSFVENSREIKIKCINSITSVNGPNTKITSAEIELKRLSCLEDESKAHPLVALELTKFIKYGASCPLFKLAAESSRDDNQCLEKLKMQASCEDWSRLEELVKLGSRTLVSKASIQTGKSLESKGGQ